MSKLRLYGTAGALVLGVLILAEVSVPASLKPVLAALLFLALFIAISVAIVALALWLGIRAIYPKERPIRPPRRMPRAGRLSSLGNPSSRDFPQ